MHKIKEIIITFLKKSTYLSRYQKQATLVFIDVLVLELSIVFSYSLRQAQLYFPSFSDEKLMLISPFDCYSYILFFWSIPISITVYWF